MSLIMTYYSKRTFFGIFTLFLLFYPSLTISKMDQILYAIYTGEKQISIYCSFDQVNISTRIDSFQFTRSL